MNYLSSVYNNDTTDMLFTRDAGGVDYVETGGNCRSCKGRERILGNVSCAIRERGYLLGVREHQFLINVLEI